MRRALGLLAGFCFGLALPLLMAQLGGFPSRPRFQAVGIGSVASATVGELSALGNVNAVLTHLIDNDSNGTSNAARLSISSGDATTALFTAGSGRTASLITNGPTGAQAVLRTLGAYPIVFGTSNTLAATISSAQVVDFVNAPTIAGTVLLESGTFTASFATACTTTPTVTFDYQRSGNIVVLQAVASSGFPCTSDSTSFLSTADAPASIRPASGTGANSSPLDNFTDNGAATWAKIQVGTGGAITFFDCSTYGANCGAWTGSGSKGFVPAQQSFAYMLGNP